MQGRGHSAGAAWEAAMRHEYEEHVVEETRRREEKRIQDARTAISNQLALLKRLIRELGRRGDDGKIHVSYGTLFDETATRFSMLSGTLVIGRKHHVVDFEGETLFQGRDDNVDIVLLDETVDEDFRDEIAIRDKGSEGAEEERDPFAIDSALLQRDTCYECGEAVARSDRVGVSDVALHRKCFVCYVCHAPLTPARYGSNKNEAGHVRFYCTPHFESLFKVNANYETGFKQAERK